MHEYERMTINNFKMLPYERGTAAKARKANPKLKMLEILYTFLCTFLTPRGAGAVERKHREERAVMLATARTVRGKHCTRVLLHVLNVW